MILLVAAACLGDRPRPGPPQLSLTIDDTTVVASRADTVSGTVRASDPDGIDSVWVTVDSQQRAIDGGFGQTFSSPYRFVIPAGQQPGTHLPMSFRARDVAAFVTQRDTYVVVVP